MADKRLGVPSGVICGTALLFLMGGGDGVIAAERQGKIDPLMKSYIECINGAARNQQTEGSDKISSAQSVTASCENEKRALLKARPDRKTASVVARIEQHLKSRERPEPRQSQ